MDVGVEAAVTASLQRIQGIVDADGGRFLGEYGFSTVKDALFDARRAHEALVAEIETLRSAIDAALNELGVPQPDYPAPVANAVAILAAVRGGDAT
jgi:hypothetical protein